jgi:hypothetical protein
MASEEKKDPSSSSARPAGKTTTRWASKSPGAVATRSKRIKGDVAIMTAEGMGASTIGKALDMSRESVYRIQKLPEVQQRVSELRDIHRLVTQEKMAGVTEKAWKLTETTLDNGDPTGFMRMATGISHLEKVSQSASGDAHRVQVSGIPGEQNPKIEIKNLLLALFPEKK